MVVSIWWWFGYCSKSWLLDIGDGTIYYAPVETNEWSTPLYGWSGGVNETLIMGGTGINPNWKWTWWTWGKSPRRWEDGRAYTVWPLSPILFIVGSAMLFPGLRAHRRRSKSQCPSCGYSREGLPKDRPCPECGTIEETATSLAR
jgi:hypothetical protein